MTEKQNIQITHLTLSNDLDTYEKKLISQEQLEQDFAYSLAQQQLQSLLNCGLISLVEFNKIMQINRDTFSPFLVEIMSEIR